MVPGAKLPKDTMDCAEIGLEIISSANVTRATMIALRHRRPRISLYFLKFSCIATSSSSAIQGSRVLTAIFQFRSLAVMETILISDQTAKRARLCQHGR